MREEIKDLEQEIEELTKEQEECLASIRALQAEEDPLNGVFRATEIHAAKQDKMRLDFEIQFRRNKINRIKFGG